MAEWRLLASAGSSLLVSSLYAYIAFRLWARPGQDHARRAVRRFAVFWAGVGLHGVLSAILVLAFVVGGPDVWLVTAATYAAAFAIAGMMWGLMSYLLYLYVGRPGVFPAATLAYVAQLVPLVAAVYLLRPTGAHMEGWVPIIDYASPSGSALDAVAALVFVLPPLFAAVAYLSLYRNVREPASRWRLGLVGGGLALWFLISLFSRAIAIGPPDVGAAIGRLVALAAGLVLLLAYEPPSWARRRFGAVRLGEEVVAPAPDPALVARRREALAARAKDLL